MEKMTNKQIDIMMVTKQRLEKIEQLIGEAKAFPELQARELATVFRNVCYLGEKAQDVIKAINQSIENDRLAAERAQLANEARERILANGRVKLSDVDRVYSGKPGKCMCGCSGRHAYSKKGAARENARHAGDSKWEAIKGNDKTVKKIVDKMNLAIEQELKIEEYNTSTIYSVTAESDMGTPRLYVAFVERQSSASSEVLAPSALV